MYLHCRPNMCIPNHAFLFLRVLQRKLVFIVIEVNNSPVHLNYTKNIFADSPRPQGEEKKKALSNICLNNYTLT